MQRNGLAYPKYRANDKAAGTKTSPILCLDRSDFGLSSGAVGERLLSLHSIHNIDGVYEWTRVPMGLKGAPSYDKRELASTVLRDILYHICKLYIDDIIVYGNFKEEFQTNVELVFERLAKHRLTVNL